MWWLRLCCRRNTAIPVASSARAAYQPVYKYSSVGRADEYFESHEVDKKIVASKLTIDQLVDRYADLSTLVRPTPVSCITPDPDDDVVIGTALAAQEQWIVTVDKALLSVT